MSESIKAVCVLVLVVACFATVFAWFADRPDALTWSFRVGCPIVAVLAVGLIFVLNSRADVAPDYLHRCAGNYFNRGGFCFALAAIPVDGVCYLVAYFQNQRDQPCLGRIALRPARGFFLRRAKIETITFEVNCEPAAFGWTRIPVPLIDELQGRRQTFEVGASVDYRQGKGHRLRFRDGIFIRANSNFGNAFATTVIVAGTLTGHIVLTRPATTTIALPSGVAEDIPEELKPETETLWRLGDPTLESVEDLIRGGRIGPG